MSTTEQKKIVVVIGPGRSGTSAITRGLTVLGVDLGTNLMPAKIGVNDKGFWEDQDIYSLNIEIFKELGRSWHTLTAIDVNSIPIERLAGLKDRAVELLKTKTKVTRVYGLKDPQITRLLPFWRDVFQRISARDYYVIACRNPISVAHSLEKYTGISLEKAFQLWFEYTLTSLLETTSSRRLVVSYDHLMNDATTQLARIADCLELPSGTDMAALREYRSEFLDPSLRHSEFDLNDVLTRETVPPKVSRLYCLMLKFAEDGVLLGSRDATLAIEEFLCRHREDSAMLKLAQDSEDLAAARLAQVTERDTLIADLGQTIQSVVTDRDSQKAGLTQLHQAYTDLTRDRDEQARRVAQTVSECDEKVGQLMAVVDERNATIRRLQGTVAQVIAERDDRVERLEKALSDNQTQIRAQQQRIGSLEKDLAAVYQSTSWRLTGPMRMIVTAVKRAFNAMFFGKGQDKTTGRLNQAVEIPSVTPSGVESPSDSRPQSASLETYRILLVSYYCPTRAHGGGLRILDIYSMIKRHRPSVQIDLLTHHRPEIDWSIDDAFRIFDNVYLSPVEELTPEILNSLRGQSPIDYDLIDLQFHQSAYHIEAFRKIGRKIIFTPMECQAKLLYLDIVGKLKTGKMPNLARMAGQIRLSAEEIAFSWKVDEVVCVSQTDAAFLRKVGGSHRVCGIETGLSNLEFAQALAPGFRPESACRKRRNIIYIAYFGSETNVRALRWYLEQVHPAVKQQVPDYVLTVVGRGDLSCFHDFRGDNVDLVGEVAEIAPYITDARVGIAPALSGSGFRGKINQYAILGVPCVVSPIALKGLAYKNGESILVAEKPADFADCCIRLLTDADLNDRVAAAARDYCASHYTWETKWRSVSTVYGLKDST